MSSLNERVRQIETNPQLPKASLTNVDGSGVLTEASQTTAPTAPTAGNGILFSQSRVGRDVPFWQDSIAQPHQLQSSLLEKTFVEITPAGAAAIRTIGTGATPGTVGTLSLVANQGTIPTYENFLSAATSGITASMIAGSTHWRRGTAGQLSGGVLFDATYYFPDASYNNTGVSTGTRIHVGLTSSTTTPNWLGTDYGQTVSGMFFARNSVNGGAVDTNWQIVTCDGATKTNADTGMVWTAQHVYRSRMFVALGGTTLYWRIDDLTAATVFSGSTATTLPAATTNMFSGMGVLTIDATARTIGLVQHWTANDK